LDYKHTAARETRAAEAKALTKTGPAFTVWASAAHFGR